MRRGCLFVDGADPDTFEVITVNFNERDREGVKQFHFARDKNQVYHLGKRLKGVDSKTFNVLNKDFARDNKKLYALYVGRYRHRLEEVEGIGPNQFKATAVSFLYQYNKGLYYKTGDLRLIEDVDLSTFEVFNYKDTRGYSDTIYAKDKNRLYWIDPSHYNCLNLPVKIDPLQLSILNRYYFHDNKTVYFRTLEPEHQGERIWILQPVVGADVATFKVSGDAFDGDSAVDKNGEYYKGIRIEIDRP